MAASFCHRLDSFFVIPNSAGVGGLSPDLRDDLAAHKARPGHGDGRSRHLTPEAVSAAATITKGVERGLYAVGLTKGERRAIVACLEDPPGGLVELRGALMREVVR